MSAYKRVGVRTPSTKRARRSGTRRKKIANQRMVPSAIYQPLVCKGYSFPLRLQNQMRYAEEVQLVGNGIGYANYLFRTNGLYDPNYTGTGHQPMYFDRLSSIYNHYHVMASHIRVTPVRTGGAIGVELCVYIDDDTATNVTEFSTAVERPGSKVVFSWPTAGNQPTVHSFWNAKYAFGGNVIDNDTLKGTSASDPSEQQYFVINMQAEPADTCNVLVEIEYTVVWSELKSEGQS